jgi:uncharacterized protein
MQLQWADLGAAVALYLVLEGIMPFLNPEALKRAAAKLSETRAQSLRIIGAISMLSGLTLLHFVQR